MTTPLCPPCKPCPPESVQIKVLKDQYQELVKLYNDLFDLYKEKEYANEILAKRLENECENKTTEKVSTEYKLSTEDEAKLSSLFTQPDVQSYNELISPKLPEDTSTLKRIRKDILKLLTTYHPDKCTDITKKDLCNKLALLINKKKTDIDNINKKKTDIDNIILQSTSADEFNGGRRTRTRRTPHTRRRRRKTR
jgi:hypothetical protein